VNLLLKQHTTPTRNKTKQYQDYMGFRTIKEWNK